MLDTAKEFGLMVWNMLNGMPMFFLALLGIVIFISALLSGMMCFFDSKKKKKKKLKELEKTNKDLLVKKEDAVFEETKEVSIKSPIEENKNNALEKETLPVKQEISLESKRKEPVVSLMSNTDEDVKEKSIDFIDFGLDSFSHKNVNINNVNFIDEIKIEKSGIFLIFKEDQIKGLITGEVFNEYLYIGKEKKNKTILNPTFKKFAYKKIVNRWFKTSEDNIEILFLTPKIKKSNPELNLFKTENELLSYIEEKQELFTNDEVFNLNESVYFLDRRR